MGDAHEIRGHVPTLSVVIPAFKPSYLADALQSLRRQTYQNFEVIVADDASPYEIQRIYDEHAQELNAKYHRFDENLGSVSLTAHWDRAVALAKGEWILLLGDDDILDSQLVENYIYTIQKNQQKYDVYRVNTKVINKEGEVIRDNPVHPEWESALDFMRARLRWERRSYTCEYVFSKKAMDEIGGFIPFPLAWCSDDATWIALSKRTGIYTIPGAKASWRISDENISSQNRNYASAKLKAAVMFLNWIHHFVVHGPVRVSTVERENLRIDGVSWFYRHLYASPETLSVKEGLEIIQGLSSFADVSRFKNFVKLLRHNVRCYLATFTN